VKQNLREKSEKKQKIDFNFASLCFASKQKLLNQSEAKNLKQKKQKRAKKTRKRENKRKKRSEIL
jgi:hypothetical protein